MSSKFTPQQFIGQKLYYRSAITGQYTQFTVKQVVVRIEIISQVVHFTNVLISENDNEYTYEEDYIFTAII